jgi:hypothetical protein
MPLCIAEAAISEIQRHRREKKMPKESGNHLSKKYEVLYRVEGKDKKISNPFSPVFSLALLLFSSFSFLRKLIS